MKEVLQNCKKVEDDCEIYFIKNEPGCSAAAAAGLIFEKEKRDE